MIKYSSLAQVQSEINAGTLSCTNLVEHYLKNINDKKDLNAFLEVFDQEALERASMLDQKKENRGKLYGLVIAIKDTICYKGHKISASSKMLENFQSLYSSTAVERLLEQDAIIIGRVNCDEFAMGSSNENSAYGNVKNFADKSKTPGGSSGGSAVAVQADLCLASLGSDTGGSIRQPASFCGVVGVKPTYGRVSRHGLIAFASSFDQIGPFTHNIEDSAKILEVIAGKDNYDATALQENWLSEQSNKEGKKYKLAYFKECLESDGLQKETKEASERLIQKLKDNGHEVEAISFPELKYLIPTYYVLTTAEASSNLSRYDGVHYGYRSPNAKNLDELYVKSRNEGFGKEVKTRIMLGTFVLSAGYYDAYYTKAQKVRRILFDRINEIYKNFDGIISPTTPTTAFKLGAIKNPVEMYLSDIFTVLAPLVGNPAISLPYAEDKDGMPIGMQLMTQSKEENKMFAISHEIINAK